MLVFAVEYQKALDKISGDRALKLRRYELSADEWKIAVELRDVLKVFKDATLFFSRSTPHLATVIPAMDHIDETLATHSLDPRYQRCIQTSLTIGKKTLNRYYNLTDDSEVYRIAMVLHPRHKLNYFKNARWEESWINTARDIVRDEFERSYSSNDDGLELTFGSTDTVRTLALT
ncbi:hypothetical protein BD410DRAFT_735159 [Rickenella mellea]|uniref:hAT-like transposase RNase-H fold domain-containing protein n=1 Tax=Rickenella mellea TaxID=50990 RepID=A0A4Y7PFJ7_9AGAM|nr:hypothetical protein BD410DRAFT_735159 [Rickenella mellea]